MRNREGLNGDGSVAMVGARNVSREEIGDPISSKSGSMSEISGRERGVNEIGDATTNSGVRGIIDNSGVGSAEAPVRDRGREVTGGGGGKAGTGVAIIAASFAAKVEGWGDMNSMGNGRVTERGKESVDSGDSIRRSSWIGRAPAMEAVTRADGDGRLSCVRTVRGMGRFSSDAPDAEESAGEFGAEASANSSIRV